MGRHRRRPRIPSITNMKTKYYEYKNKISQIWKYISKHKLNISFFCIALHNFEGVGGVPYQIFVTCTTCGAGVNFSLVSKYQELTCFWCFFGARNPDLACCQILSWKWCWCQQNDKYHVYEVQWFFALLCFQVLTKTCTNLDKYIWSFKQMHFKIALGRGHHWFWAVRCTRGLWPAGLLKHL